ncbi:hypothetical protein GCM10009579_03430 [Streptomyces javensis]|uniref:Uncharacterized protein n=1 Tax=Streptomyces javensis TaxID=114698 RepID=A0ABN1WGF6_9ACTN
MKAAHPARAPAASTVRRRGWFDLFLSALIRDSELKASRNGSIEQKAPRHKTVDGLLSDEAAGAAEADFGAAGGNSRDGSSPETVLTDAGAVTVTVPPR